MKTYLLLLLLGARLACSATLTASDAIAMAFFEFNADQATNVGPDYSYVWVSPISGDHWVNGTVYNGPGWVRVEYDADWNFVSQDWFPGYSVTLSESVPLALADIRPSLTSTANYFSDICAALAYWESLGGYDSGLCLEPTIASTVKGKKLGHTK